MKLRVFVGGCVIGAAAALVTAGALSQDTGSGLQPAPEDIQKAFAEYAKKLEPGRHHRMLDQFIGNWNTTMRTYWGGPGSQPVVTHGSASFEWVLDGRFVLETVKGEVMWPDPQTGGMQAKSWNGRGLTGFDNHRNMFESTWADNLGTHIYTMKGAADPGGKTFTYYGEMDEPMLGVIGRYVKYVTHIVSDDRHIFEIYDLHAGDDYKVVEVTYERVK